jgi:hypothetical protein
MPDFLPGLPWDIIVYDTLWFLVMVGWVLLIITGLEADKPLSGGLPTHADIHADQDASAWSANDRLGATIAWVLFGLVAAGLPVILWWIFAVHEPVAGL